MQYFFVIRVVTDLVGQLTTNYEDLGLNSERLCGSLLEGDPGVVHQHVDPSVSEARLVVQGCAILV